MQKTNPGCCADGYSHAGNGRDSGNPLDKKFNPEIKVVMLTTFQIGQHCDGSKAGAEGYLLKTDKIANIPNQLRMLYSGTSVR